MTTLSDPPKGDFRIGMLLSDTRYRSYTFQFLALLAIILSVSYLVSNLLANLDRLGQDLSYEFLGAPAGYDINQQPIPYDSQDTHLRAAVVGALNTLIVAFLACVTATVFGVIAGVLRLSNNWIISKLMSIYVEIFRNIPVLIWLIIIFTITANVFAPIAEFRIPRDGTDPARTLIFGVMAFTNQGVFIPRLTFDAGGAVVMWTFIASIIGIFVYKGYIKKHLFDTGRELPFWLPALAIFFIPTLLMFFILGRPVGVELPEMGRFRFEGGLQLRTSFIALWFALSIYTGAFIAENVRAGILAISKGQTEAASALGLRPNRTMSLVVLPQALRVIIPPLISQYLNITKNSSLAIAVGYMDLTGTLGGITLNQTGRAIECILLLMLFYLTISLLISLFMNWYNNSVKLKER
jgi:general L-amino acid transport system permease protein